MPRDLSSSGRSAPQLFHQPLAFYTAIRLGDPDVLTSIMSVDPYFPTQDNGAGSPLHFSVTYKRLDMALHLLNLGAEINQRDTRGLTPLHRAAFLAHIEGYMELYEFLLSHGADPSILSHVTDDYINPGGCMAIDLAVDDGGETRIKIKSLELKYAHVPKARVPHAAIGDWISLLDYGLDEIKTWPIDYDPKYPEMLMRQRMKAGQLKARAERRAERDRILNEMESSSSVAGLPLPPAASPVAFLFPGQGSQAVGMLSMAKDLPKVKEMLTKAEAILGFDLLDICLNGPKELLDSTKFAQPALLVADLAAAEMYKGHQSPSYYAGLSLGEYAALIAAGAMSFEDGIKVVKVRSEEMDKCATSALKRHGMLSVVGVDDSVLAKICSSALEEVKKKEGLTRDTVVCQISNYLFPQGRVVSGHLDCLAIVEASAKAKGALKTLSLAVAGGFHTPLMEPARLALVQALASIEIQKPLVPVVSNVTGLPFPDDPEAIRSLLAAQLVQPVLWESSIKFLLEQGKNRLVEAGPGTQIKAMVRRIDPNNAWKHFQGIQP